MLQNAIKCALCQHPFFSVLIDPDPRIADLVAQLSRHLENKHKEQLIRSIQSTQQTAKDIVQFIFFNNLAVIPEENTVLTKYFETLQEQILRAFGYETDMPDDEGDDEDDELLDRLSTIAKDCPDEATREKLELLISSLLEEEETGDVTDTEEKVVWDIVTKSGTPESKS